MAIGEDTRVGGQHDHRSTWMGFSLLLSLHGIVFDSSINNVSNMCSAVFSLFRWPWPAVNFGRWPTFVGCLDLVGYLWL